MNLISHSSIARRFRPIGFIFSDRTSPGEKKIPLRRVCRAITSGRRAEDEEENETARRTIRSTDEKENGRIRNTDTAKKVFFFSPGRRENFLPPPACSAPRRPFASFIYLLTFFSPPRSLVSSFLFSYLYFFCYTLFSFYFFYAHPASPLREPPANFRTASEKMKKHSGQ